MKLARFLNIVAALAMVFAALGVAYTPAVAQDGGPVFDRNTLYVPGELVVTFGRDAGMREVNASALAVAESLGGEVVGTAQGSTLLSFDESADVEALAQEIANQPGVAKVEQNYISWIPEAEPQGSSQSLDKVVFRSADGKAREVSRDQLRAMRTVKKVNGRTQAIPTYPVESYYDNWGWWSIGADIIWPEKAVSPGVCVVDTGVDGKHPDLVGKVINGLDFVNDDTKPDDDNGHGTHVSGTIAALINNKKGFSGISNGKVVAVKVLTAQGWGTSWDIASGIGYCADRVDVKVINLSLGGSFASDLEFSAIEYAVNNKNKLVVVAAGNESTGDFSFPAAWAAPYVCADGSSTYPAGCPTNVVYQGMLSVGASPSRDSTMSDTNEDGYLWVDTDGDGVEITDENDPAFFDEHFYPDQCATDFSNYGAWVNITAPGEDILSTLPVSYPFYDEYYYNEDWDNDGYESYSGTSMATPHVAGAAARVWSLNPTQPNTFIRTQLLNTGDTFLAFAMDPNMSDPLAGYADLGYNGEAPFCWPDNTFGSDLDNSSLVSLNVAAAMNRGGIWAEVYDAITGLPLKGASVKAFQGTVLKDTSMLTVDWSPSADLINLPAGVPITVKVNKVGNTVGDQTINTVTPTAGFYEWGPWLNIGVPPSTRIHVVANWDGFYSDLELFTWTAKDTFYNVDPGYIVGPWDPGTPEGLYIDEGDLAAFPFARWNREGGAADWLTMESITIASKPGSTTIPYYNLTINDKYDFLLTDLYQPGLLNEYVVVRVWAAGKIIGVNEKTAVCDTDGVDNIDGNDDDELWWKAGYMTLGVFTKVDDCGTGAVNSILEPNGAWPYRVFDRSINSGIPERPTKTK